MPLPRARTDFVCQVCGHVSARWFGRCPGCGEWNTLESAAPQAPAEGQTAAVPLAEVADGSEGRLASGVAEFDRVLGGGLPPGALMLLGGDPGVGKSTLLLQVAGRLGASGPVLYASGEESAAQIKARARRLDALSPGLHAAAVWDTASVEAMCARLQPRLLIVDSAQTMRHPDCPLAAGSPVQLREVAGALLRMAKTRGLPVILVGHVTKAGLLAGPRLLEHTVDAVLLFEGERYSPFRLLRALKNRFGSTQELGVFQMAADGLREVPNPSALLLAERARGVAGSVVTVAMEGSRPILCEVQALLCTPAFGSPRRTAHGVDSARLALLLAVLERRCALPCGQMDAYVKVAGGVRLEEPAADLALALALASAFTDRPIPPEAVAFGEIGLGGEVRGVPRTEERLGEAARLGFTRALLPATGERSPVPGMALDPADHLRVALAAGLGTPGRETDAGAAQAAAGRSAR